MNLLKERTSTAIALKNVLFATDFSSSSEAALPYATAISRRYKSTLHAVHVFSNNPLLMSGGIDPVSVGAIYEQAHTLAQEKMQQLASRLEGIRHQTCVCHGKIWETIASIIRANEVDLLVLGTHGRTGVGKLLMGSVAEEIFRQAPCPVLSVGPKISGRARLPLLPSKGRNLAPPEITLQQIVYATDFSQDSLAAAPFAISVAEEFGAQLTLLHVIDEYVGLNERPGPIEAALQRLEAIVPEETALWCRPEPVTEFGLPADGILKVASERDADLIVLGVRPPDGHLTTATHLPWRTAHKVVAQANCPVLTIRG